MQFVPVISILVRRPPRRGGDPFSHPSGSGMERRSGCQTNDGRRSRLVHALLPESGSQKTFSAQTCSYRLCYRWLVWSQT